ncbi:MAG: hypothetical protein ACI4SY_05960 [Sutterella sp.]
MKAHSRAELIGMWVIGFARSLFRPWWGMLYIASLFFISAVVREEFGSGVVFGMALSIIGMSAVLAYIDAQYYVRSRRWSFWTYRKTHEGVLIFEGKVCLPPNQSNDLIIQQFKGQV